MNGLMPGGAVLAVGVEVEDAAAAAAAGEESSEGVARGPDGARLLRGRGRIGAETIVAERMMCLPGRIGRLHHPTGPTLLMRGCKRDHFLSSLLDSFIPVCVCL
jgi:hypothetical protein